jgi:hypothetical protein
MIKPDETKNIYHSYGGDENNHDGMKKTPNIN